MTVPTFRRGPNYIFNQWQLAFSYLLNPFLLATSLTTEISSFLYINQLGSISTSFWRYPLKSVRRKALGWISYFTPSGLKVVFYTHQIEQAIELPEKLALSAKIEEVSRFGENEIKVTICRVPLQFKDDEIADELKIYGEIFKINALKDRYGMQIGKRYVFFKKNTMKEIPRFLTMGGVQIWHTITNNLPTVTTAKKKFTKETIVKNYNIRDNVAETQRQRKHGRTK